MIPEVEELPKSNDLKHRFLEILPPLISWNLILFPIWGSLVFPQVVAYFILAFNVYWVYLSADVGITVFLSHLRIKEAEDKPWLEKLDLLEDTEKLHHLVIIPTYKEPAEVLRKSISSLKNQSLDPRKHLSLVIAQEERAGERFLERARDMQDEFAEDFAHLWVVEHPDIEGEVKGKSSNESYASRVAKQRLVGELGYDLAKTTVTTQDADVCFHPEYFAALSYEFWSHPNRYQRFWQAPIFFYNNIWELPLPSRVFSVMATMVGMWIINRRGHSINFSTYSMSLKLLDEVGYWDTDVIPEDFRMFFKAFFKTQGELKLEPIFLPSSQDAAGGAGFKDVFLNTYYQQQRWAWGVSDIPHFIRWAFKVPKVPFIKKASLLLTVMQYHFLWPVNWFLITLGASLPPLLNDAFSRTVLGFNLPRFSSIILTISMFFLLILIWVDYARRPKPSPGQNLARMVLEYAGLILLPLVALFFSALPGLDAHTRLLFGKYIEYKVTEKGE